MLGSTNPAHLAFYKWGSCNPGTVSFDCSPHHDLTDALGPSGQRHVVPGSALLLTAFGCKVHSNGFAIRASPAVSRI
jgi:hypothetical protein